MLYGKGNEALLEKMVGNVFKQQPKYEDDLRDSIPTMLQVRGSFLYVLNLLVDYSQKGLGRTIVSFKLLLFAISNNHVTFVLLLL